MNRFAPVTTAKPRPILGVIIAILVPLMTAGILIGVLHKPQEQLGQVTAAIVNNDEPVELEGQLVPLGRQLAGGLVASGEADSGSESDSDAAAAGVRGYQWEITDSTRAVRGLEDGTYGAVVEIPPNFSAAATSTAGDLDSVEQATISITTSPKARILDDAITSAIGLAATEMLGSELTETYLDNIFVGFNTLHDELGGAADGAGELAAGTGELTEGVSELHEGTTELGAGAGQLADGAQELAGGLGEMHGGISELRQGSGALVDGAGELAGGAGELAGGISGLQDGLADLAGGSGELTEGLRDLAAGTATLPEQFAPLTEGINGLEDGADQLTEGLQLQSEGLGDLRDLACSPLVQDASGRLCAGLQELADSFGQSVEGAIGLSLGAQAINDGVGDMTAAGGPLAELAGGVEALADGSQELTAGLGQARDGAGETAIGARGLADGASDLAAGAAELHGGIGALEEGSSDIGVGASELSLGTSELADAIGEVDAGVGELADGSGELNDGATQLAEGLDEAVDEIPTYPDGQREEAARVISAPVTLAEASDSPFNLNLLSNWIGFFTVIALWISALWIYTGVPTTARNYTATTRSSAWVSVRSLALPAAVAVGQALVVTILVGVFGDLAGGKLLGFAGVAILIALAFLLVQRALVAVLGRWGLVTALGIAILAIATALTSAMPALAGTVANWLPIGPAADALLGVENGLGIAGPVALLSIWALAGWIVVALNISRRRATLA